MKRRPYSNCVSDSASESDLESSVAKRSFLRNNFKYKQVVCFETCQNDYVQKVCSADMNKELTVDDQICIAMSVFDFYENSSLTSLCRQQCPLDCRFVDYSLSSSQARYPTDAYRRTLKNFFAVSQRNATNNFTDALSVNIFYKVRKGYVV